MKLVFPGGEHPQVLLDAGVNRVGSDPHGQVVINRPDIAPRLCQLHVTAQGVMLDVPEGASIEVNGRRVDGLIALRPGDSVALGGIEARLAGVGTVLPAAGDALEALPPANDDLGATTVRPVVPEFVLRCVAGSLFGRNVPVHGVVTFGRAPECTVTVEDSGLSRLHARLLPGDGHLVLEDMGSSNGSFVNGRRVVRAEVRTGDEIGMDTLRFRVVSNTRADEARRPARDDSGQPGWVMPVLAALAVVAAGIAAYLLA
ncbi:hypothetical protein N799_12665 [Lysobacter arseniciresistens ZS79]|uniref:FHA domain-containing protein n=1 Tax=Lysobacter arseniciresistens ZS79 TaxID=913325 RepID=A0A0A0F6P2_9GAMM|nr:FHA domain-containing protein [Lysobacter arseniciresistens]KGM57042.1 hypothetical protein N799_12665 [Lysobacter arseniciresistens ZS79]